MLNSAENGTAMPQTRLFEDLSARLGEIIAAGPAKDVEKNLRAMLSTAFAKFDLATREELEIQAKVLARTREKLSELEARIAELEAGLRKQ
jgi:BMFP domain-containing protein YqiC